MRNTSIRSRARSACVRKRHHALRLQPLDALELEAAEVLSRDHGIEAEVIDLYALSPLDREGIIGSVSKTHRALISEEAEAPVGVGSEVMAIINEGCFYELDCAPKRVSSLNVPVPYNHHLEAAAIPDASWVVKAALEMFGKEIQIMAKAYPIKVPALSATMTDGILVTWEREIGDPVERGDVVATLETDKAIMDVESFRDGFLSGPRALIGSTVPVGEAIAFVVESKEDVEGGELEMPEPGSTPAAEPAAPTAASSPAPSVPVPSAPAAAALPVAGAVAARPLVGKASPWARKLAAQLGVDLNTLSGSGPDGLRQGFDVLAASGAGAGAFGGGSPALVGPASLDASAFEVPGNGRAMSPIEAATAQSMTASLAMPTFRVMVRPGSTS